MPIMDPKKAAAAQQVKAANAALKKVNANKKAAQPAGDDNKGTPMPKMNPAKIAEAKKAHAAKKAATAQQVKAANKGLAKVNAERKAAAGDDNSWGNFFFGWIDNWFGAGAGKALKESLIGKEPGTEDRPLYTPDQLEAMKTFLTKGKEGLLAEPKYKDFIDKLAQKGIDLTQTDVPGPLQQLAQKASQVGFDQALKDINIPHQNVIQDVIQRSQQRLENPTPLPFQSQLGDLINKGLGQIEKGPSTGPGFAAEEALTRKEFQEKTLPQLFGRIPEGAHYSSGALRAITDAGTDLEAKIQAQRRQAGLEERKQQALESGQLQNLLSNLIQGTTNAQKIGLEQQAGERDLLKNLSSTGLGGGRLGLEKEDIQRKSLANLLTNALQGYGLEQKGLATQLGGLTDLITALGGQQQKQFGQGLDLANLGLKSEFQTTDVPGQIGFIPAAWQQGSQTAAAVLPALMKALIL